MDVFVGLRHGYPLCHGQMTENFRNNDLLLRDEGRRGLGQDWPTCGPRGRDGGIFSLAFRLDLACRGAQLARCGGDCSLALCVLFGRFLLGSSRCLIRLGLGLQLGSGQFLVPGGTVGCGGFCAIGLRDVLGRLAVFRRGWLFRDFGVLRHGSLRRRAGRFV